MADNDNFYSSLQRFEGVVPADTTAISAETDDRNNFPSKD